MRAWLLVILFACASTTAPPAAQAPEPARDVLAEVLATLRAGECEAAARHDLDARFRHWAPDAELHRQRQLGGALSSRVWGKDDAREVLDGIANSARLRGATPECAVVDDLEPALQRLRDTDIEALAQRVASEPRARQPILPELRQPTVWMEIVDHEVVDRARVVVRYRVFERPPSEVHDAEATFVERDGRWVLVRLARARTETIAPMRRGERFDDAYYAALDAAVTHAAASGDVACEVEALLAADRAPEAFERWRSAADLAQDEALTMRVLARARRLEELPIPAGTSLSEQATMRVLMPPPRVCGATYDAQLGHPRHSARVAAFRVCSSEDEAKLVADRAGRATLSATDFCTPPPSRLRVFFDALVATVAACRSDRRSGTEALTFTVGEAGELTSVGGDEPARMTRCLRRALDASPFPPFRIRPPQGSEDCAFVPDEHVWFFAEVIERADELAAERGETSGPASSGTVLPSFLHMPPPAWEVSWEVTFGSTPSYRARE